MDNDSNMLISESVIPDKVQRTDTYVYWMDFAMMAFAGKERSVADWHALFAISDLELIKIWAPEVGTQCMIEGRKKRG